MHLGQSGRSEKNHHHSNKKWFKLSLATETLSFYVEHAVPKGILDFEGRNAKATTGLAPVRRNNFGVLER